MSLDDLFSSASGVPESAAPKRKRPRVLILTAQAVVLTAAVFYALRLMSLTTSVFALLAGALIIIFGLDLVRGLRPPPPSRHAGRHHEERPTVSDGLNTAVNRWEVMLDWCHTDVARFNRRVLPRLGELVDERLRQRHGLTRASDPQAARRILGDPLWSYVTMPSRRPPTPRDLELIVTALEKL